MAKAVCLHSRYATRVSFKAFPEAAKLAVNDVIDIIHPTPGWSAEGEDWGSVADAVDESEDWGLVSDAATTFADWGYVDESAGTGVHFIVEAISINYDGTVNIDARQYISSIYDYDATQAKANRLRTDLPDSYEVVAPTGLSLSDDSVLLGDGSLNPVLGISWTASTDRFVRDYEIQWKKDSESNYHSIFTPNVNASIVVEAIDTYDVRVRALNGIGSTSDWITGSQLVDDDTTAPSAPTSVTAASAPFAIQLSWTNASDADLDAVEIHVRTVNTAPVDDTYLFETVKAVSGKDQEYTISSGQFDLDTTYYIFLTAVDYAGNQSAFTSTSVNGQFLKPSTSQIDVSIQGYRVDLAVISRALDISGNITAANGIGFNNDGTKMFVVDDTTDDVSEFALSTAWDVSSASYTDAYSLDAAIGQPWGFSFNDDGTKFFVCDTTNNEIHEHSLSTAFDISTSSYTDAYDVSTETTTPAGLCFNNDGSEMYVVSNVGANYYIYQYGLSTAYDVSTASYSSGERIAIGAEATDPAGVQFNDDGLKMFVLNSDTVYQYDLSTAYEANTAEYSGRKIRTLAQDSQSFGFCFGKSGERMYVTGWSSDKVHEYNTSLVQNP